MSVCPRCMGCLEQQHGACLGLRGTCWGSVEAELRDGSCWVVLGWGSEERGRSRVRGVLGGVCSRGQAEG